ncbi:hypothetical protein VCHA49P379_50181 [Vibrio chagasii]|nr:hypothetical protein VCHA34P129_10128 [Vibrio chagasii]CAH7356258.1 hypothetical protein VCHA49P379_50181 [Vibrio chagasii]
MNKIDSGFEVRAGLQTLGFLSKGGVMSQLYFGSSTSII